MDQRIAQKIADLKKAGEVPDLSIPSFKGTLMPHQQVGALCSFLAEKFIFLDKVGLGKTVQTCANLALQKERNGSFQACIVVEEATLFQWRGEIRRFLEIEPTIVTGNKEKRTAIYTRHRDASDSYILLITYGKLRYDFDLINAIPFSTIVFDEAALLANPNQTHQYATWTCRNRRYVLLLTAEPITVGDMVQLRNCFKVMGVNLLDSEEEFVSKFVVQTRKPIYIPSRTGGPPRKIEKVKNIGVNTETLQEFKALIAPNCIRRSDSVLKGNRPFIARHIRTVEMTDYQVNQYAELRKCILQREGRYKEINKISAWSFISQALSSPSLIDPEAPVESPKLEALVSLLKGDLLGEKVVVFSKWKGMHPIISDRLTKEDISHVLYSGDLEGAEERYETQLKFTQGDKKVMVMTSAGARGLNLQASYNLVFFDILHNPAQVIQIIGRLDRIGQLAKIINVFFLVSENTIEPQVFKVLADRQGVTDAIFDESKAQIFDDELDSIMTQFL